MAPNETMNRLIAAGRRQGRPGLIDRLAGTGRLDDDRQERLNVQIAAYEDAVRRGDHIAAEMADEKITTLLDEARSRQRGESSRITETGPPAGPTPGFEGGPRRPATGRSRARSMNRVINEAIVARAAQPIELP